VLKTFVHSIHLINTNATLIGDHDDTTKIFACKMVSIGSAVLNMRG